MNMELPEINASAECVKGFSENTYKAAIRFIEKCAKYGFVLTNMKFAYRLSNGFTRYYGFKNENAVHEFFDEVVSRGCIGDETGIWSVCECVAARKVPFLPDVSFRVADICNNVKITRRAAERLSGGMPVSIDGWDKDGERARGAISSIITECCRFISGMIAALRAGLYGDADYAVNYWLE
jgi:hypothetical protein